MNRSMADSLNRNFLCYPGGVGGRGLWCGKDVGRCRDLGNGKRYGVGKNRFRRKGVGFGFVTFRLWLWRIREF